MSDNGSSRSDDSEEVIMFECKHCPGKYFNAGEKDEHRRWHREQERRGRTSRSQGQIPGGATSEATSMFTPADRVPTPEARRISRKKPSKTVKPKPKTRKPRTGKKIKPIHHYDKSVESERNNGA